MPVCIHRGQNEASYSMELELQVVVKHLTRMLETDLGSSGRAASTGDHLAVSSAPTRVLRVE